MEYKIIVLVLICNICFFFVSCNNEKKESLKAINANFNKIENNYFFTDTIIYISSKNYSLKIKNFAISNNNTKYLYKQIINFYDKNKLLDSINFEVLPSKKIINKKFRANILTCFILEISLICGKNDTLYRLYGGGTSKNLEYLSIYSLNGNLIYSSVADWDTTYLLIGDIKKIKEKFQFNDSLILDKQCSTSNIYDFLD